MSTFRQCATLIDAALHRVWSARGFNPRNRPIRPTLGSQSVRRTATCCARRRVWNGGSLLSIGTLLSFTEGMPYRSWPRHDSHNSKGAGSDTDIPVGPHSGDLHHTAMREWNHVHGPDVSDAQSAASRSLRCRGADFAQHKGQHLGLVTPRVVASRRPTMARTHFGLQVRNVRRIGVTKFQHPLRLSLIHI